jgi:hypothetical protein
LVAGGGRVEWVLEFGVVGRRVKQALLEQGLLGELLVFPELENRATNEHHRQDIQHNVPNFSQEKLLILRRRIMPCRYAIQQRLKFIRKLELDNELNKVRVRVVQVDTDRHGGDAGSEVQGRLEFLFGVEGDDVFEGDGVADLEQGGGFGKQFVRDLRGGGVARKRGFMRTTVRGVIGELK